MIERRTPRGHEQAAIGPDPEGSPPVTAVLVEHLQQKFPVALTPYNGYGAWDGMDGAINTTIDQAEQRGQQRVIDYLRNLSNSPNS